MMSTPFGIILILAMAPPLMPNLPTGTYMTQESTSVSSSQIEVCVNTTATNVRVSVTSPSTFFIEYQGSDLSPVNGGIPPELTAIIQCDYYTLNTSEGASCVFDATANDSLGITIRNATSTEFSIEAKLPIQLPLPPANGSVDFPSHVYNGTTTCFDPRVPLKVNYSCDKGYVLYNMLNADTAEVELYPRNGSYMYVTPDQIDCVPVKEPGSNLLWLLGVAALVVALLITAAATVCGFCFHRYWKKHLSAKEVQRQLLENAVPKEPDPHTTEEVEGSSSTEMALTCKRTWTERRSSLSRVAEGSSKVEDTASQACPVPHVTGGASNPSDVYITQPEDNGGTVRVMAYNGKVSARSDMQSTGTHYTANDSPPTQRL